MDIGPIRTDEEHCAALAAIEAWLERTGGNGGRRQARCAPGMPWVSSGSSQSFWARARVPRKFLRVGARLPSR